MATPRKSSTQRLVSCTTSAGRFANDSRAAKSTSWRVWSEVWSGTALLYLQGQQAVDQLQQLGRRTDFRHAHRVPLLAVLSSDGVAQVVRRAPRRGDAELGQREEVSAVEQSAHLLGDLARQLLQVDGPWTAATAEPGKPSLDVDQQSHGYRTYGRLGTPTRAHASRTAWYSSPSPPN